MNRTCIYEYTTAANSTITNMMYMYIDRDIYIYIHIHMYIVRHTYHIDITNGACTYYLVIIYQDVYEVFFQWAQI